MHGLVAYDDDSQSESEDKSIPSRSNGGSSYHSHDKSLKPGSKNSSETRRMPKSQVIIKRPTTTHKNNTRAHISDDIIRDDPPTTEKPDSTGSPMDMSASSSLQGRSEEPQDELSRIRALLKPPPIPGMEDWGIPPESTEPCDPVIEAKLAQFQALKRNPVNPKHFNDSLMSNRSFRNPHLYAKLVEFIDVDERSTNFPKNIWDPNDVREEWYADRLSDFQKSRSDQQAAAQSSGKRSQIDFAPSSSNAKGKEKEHASTRKSRFQPYSAAGTKEREKSRWG